jgi:hypothetical protein
MAKSGWRASRRMLEGIAGVEPGGDRGEWLGPRRSRAGPGRDRHGRRGRRRCQRCRHGRAAGAAGAEASAFSADRGCGAEVVLVLDAGPSAGPPDRRAELMTAAARDAATTLMGRGGYLAALAYAGGVRWLTDPSQPPVRVDDAVATRRGPRTRRPADRRARGLR